jgi:mono/diheme cytochrome c family protein
MLSTVSGSVESRTMRIKIPGTLLMLLLVGCVGHAAAQAARPAIPPPEAPRPAEHGVINFLLPIEPDPVLQHSKETYVLFGCAYCHGVDLRVRNGEAADLLHSNLVGSDVDGNIIMAILKNGIPQTAKLSPMPQFSDLSEADMHAIARWIHYSRMLQRYNEIVKAGALPAGDGTAGKALYDKSCASCHSSQEMAGIVKKTKPADLTTAVLKPAIVTAVLSYKVGEYNDTKRTAARTAHSSFTENSNPNDVSNLIAYLKTLK